MRSWRYSVALFVDAIGTGLLRPFMLLYGLRVLGLGLTQTGLALTLGLLAGLAMIPAAGRWIDRSRFGGRPVAVAALLSRVLGVVVLLYGGPLWTFVLAVILLSLGAQCWPPAHAAIVTALVDRQDEPGERARDVALSAARAVRNAGLGLGALIATVTVLGGPGALRVLAAVSGLGYLIAAGLVRTLPIPARSSTPTQITGGSLPRWFAGLWLANLPFALLFDVLEVALPAVLLEQLGAPAGWPGVIFILNTLMVIGLSVPFARRLTGIPRHSALGLAGVVLGLSYMGFLGSGQLGGTIGVGGVVAFSIVYTLGEILYSNSGTALVIASAPPHQLGRALARWELSTGLGKAMAPLILLALFAAAPWLLWVPLATATAAAGLLLAATAHARAKAPARRAAPPTAMESLGATSGSLP